MRRSNFLLSLFFVLAFAAVLTIGTRASNAHNPAGAVACYVLAVVCFSLAGSYLAVGLSAIPVTVRSRG